MKRILSSLIIFVIIIANLLAPFEYAKAQSSNELLKTDCETSLSFCIAINGVSKSASSDGSTLFGFTLVEQYINSDQWFTAIVFKDSAGAIVDVITNYRSNEPILSPKSVSTWYKGGGSKEWIEIQTGFKQTKLKPDETYTIEITSAKISRARSDLIQTTNSDPIYKTYPVSFYDRSLVLGTKENIDKSEMLYTTISLTMPSKGQIGESASDTSSLSGATLSSDALPGCGNDDLVGCVANAVYYVGYVPTSWGMWVAGQFMDFSLNYSLDSASYNTSGDFVTKAWSFIRDLCNIFFIISMLYIALGIIFEFKDSAGWKKSVSSLIIAAIAINFSLFITRIPIDLGNIGARVFYNSDLIKVTKVTDGTETTGTLSEAVVEGFDPQNIVYQGLTKINSVAGENNIEEKGGGFSSTTFLIVTIFAIIINWTALWIFFKIGLLFIGRVVSLWYHMILSPFAFISDYIPNAIKIGNFSFKSWMFEIIKLSVMPVVFMAMIYVLLLFISMGVATVGNETNGFAWVIGTIAPFVIIIIMLRKAKDTAEGFADEIAKKTTDYAGKAIGTVAGLAAGGAGILGTATLGRFAGKLAGSGFAGKLAETEAKGGLGGFAAKYALKSIDVAKKGTYDARNTQIGNQFSANGFGALKDKNLDRVSQALRLDDKQGSYSDRKKAAAMRTNEDIEGTKKRIDDLSSDAVKGMKTTDGKTWEQFNYEQARDFLRKARLAGIPRAEAEEAFKNTESDRINEFKGKLKGSQEKRWQENLKSGKGIRGMSIKGNLTTAGVAGGVGLTAGVISGGATGLVTGAQQRINRDGEDVVLSGMEKIERLEKTKGVMKNKIQDLQDDFDALPKTDKAGKKRIRNQIDFRKKQVEAIDKSIEATKKAYTKGEEKK